MAADMLTLVVAAATRHEIDKLTAGQRLDLNLEKGRMRYAVIACLPADALTTRKQQFPDMHVTMQG